MSPTILLVELGPREREPIRTALAPDWTAVDCSFDGARTALESAAPALVIAPFAPATNHLRDLCRLLRVDASARYVALAWVCGWMDPSEQAAALELGADDVLTLPNEGELLRARLKALVRRGSHAEQLGAQTLEQRVKLRCDHLAQRASLSVREREVLDLLLLGRSLGEIALVLQITARTAKFHQANILDKLGADSRLDLLRLLIQ